MTNILRTHAYYDWDVKEGEQWLRLLVYKPELKLIQSVRVHIVNDRCSGGGCQPIPEGKDKSLEEALAVMADFEKTESAPFKLPADGVNEKNWLREGCKMLAGIQWDDLLHFGSTKEMIQQHTHLKNDIPVAKRIVIRKKQPGNL